MSKEYKEMLEAYDIPSDQTFRNEMWMILLKVVGRSDEYFILARVKYTLRKLYGEKDGSYMKEIGEILDKINKRRKALLDVMHTKELLEGLHQNAPEVYSYDR